MVHSGAGAAELTPTVGAGQRTAAVVQVSGVANRDALRGWLTEHAEPLRAQLHRSGHLHLRGLPLHNAADFTLARDLLVRRPADQRREESTLRTDFGGGVFSATDLPPAQRIRLHNEDSYSTVVPGLLLFTCRTAAESGGATTLGDVRAVLDALAPELVERFRERGWLVVRTFQPGLGISWQRAFGTDDPATAEEYCARLDLSCERLSGGRLRTAGLRSTTLRHPETGHELWFNHIAVFNEWTHDPEVRELLLESCGPDGLPQNTYYGDGEPIEADVVAELNRGYDEAMIRVDWRPGDLLVVDNLRCAHGREPFTGTREVLVAMGDPVDVRTCSPSGRVSAGHPE